MLELQNISFKVDEGNTEVQIIKNLSLTIPNQKFVILTGPNGSGKSTLAKIIAGYRKKYYRTRKSGDKFCISTTRKI